MDLDKLIALSKIAAKPWSTVVMILALLLTMSVTGNVYQSMNGTDVNIIADSNTDSTVVQSKS